MFNTTAIKALKTALSSDTDTPLVMGENLVVDGVRDYDALIKDKDLFIKFLTCMVENERFDFFCENNINDFLEHALERHALWCDDVGCKYTHQPFNPEQEYGIKAQGEI